MEVEEGYWGDDGGQDSQPPGTRIIFLLFDPSSVQRSQVYTPYYNSAHRPTQPTPTQILSRYGALLFVDAQRESVWAGVGCVGLWAVL